MLRRSLAAVSHYRPRVLTFFVLAAVASLLLRANSIGVSTARSNSPKTNPPTAEELQFEAGEPAPGYFNFWNLSYGWPLSWRQYVTVSGGGTVVGETYSAGRLAANLAIWLLLLAAPAGACEWLLRRYCPLWRYLPRLRFSLRTLLIATGLAGSLSGWFAAAYHRASTQDPLIAAVNGRGGRIWGERWGPKWLERYGADRFCRRVFGAEFNAQHLIFPKNPQEFQYLFDDVSRASDLQYLSLKADRLTPENITAIANLRRLETLQIETEGLAPGAGRALADALGGMQRLHILSISGSDRLLNETASEWLPVVGRLSRLEHLRLRNWTVASEDLAPLAGLTKLETLTLERVNVDQNLPEWDVPLLARLPALAQLESLELTGSQLDDRDLPHIARLSRLKSLNLSGIYFTGRALADLAPLAALEELAVDFYAPEWDSLEALVKLKGLKKLHIDSFDEEAWRSRDALRAALPVWVQDHEVDNSLRAFAALRKANPGLVIDDNDEPLRTFEARLAPPGEIIRDFIGNPSESDIFRQAVQAWKEKQARNVKSQGAARAPGVN